MQPSTCTFHSPKPDPVPLLLQTVPEEHDADATATEAAGGQQHGTVPMTAHSPQPPVSTHSMLIFFSAHTPCWLEMPPAPSCRLCCMGPHWPPQLQVAGAAKGGSQPAAAQQHSPRPSAAGAGQGRCRCQHWMSRMSSSRRMRRVSSQRSQCQSQCSHRATQQQTRQMPLRHRLPAGQNPPGKPPGAAQSRQEQRQQRQHSLPLQKRTRQKCRSSSQWRQNSQPHLRPGGADPSAQPCLLR